MTAWSKPRPVSRGFCFYLVRFAASSCPAFVPGIHALLCCKDVDGRDKPGHDGKITSREAGCDQKIKAISIT
jgi:hypothetical protein